MPVIPPRQFASATSLRALRALRWLTNLRAARNVPRAAGFVGFKSTVQAQRRLSLHVGALVGRIPRMNGSEVGGVCDDARVRVRA